MWWRNCDDILSRFYIIPERDRQRQTAQYRASSYFCWRAVKYNTFGLMWAGRLVTTAPCHTFLPRDAMYRVDYAGTRCPSVRLFVRLSHAGILSKRLHISLKCLYIGPHHPSFCEQNGMTVFWRGPLMGASNARSTKKSPFSTNVSLHHGNHAR